jgi:hypothetical protein
MSFRCDFHSLLGHPKITINLNSNYAQLLHSQRTHTLHEEQMTCVDRERPSKASAEHHHSSVEKLPSEQVELAGGVHADVIDWTDMAFKM